MRLGVLAYPLVAVAVLACLCRPASAEPERRRLRLETPALNVALDLAFPLRASVPLPQGWLPAGELDRLALVESGQKSRIVTAQFEPAMRWADGSIAVLHVPYVARWDAGVPRTYWLGRAEQVVRQPEAAPADTTLLRELAVKGPMLIDSRGMEQRAEWDEELPKNISVETGPAVTRVEASGWYETKGKAVLPLARFWMLAERYADAPRIITVDFATTLADFDGAGIAKLGFEMLDLPEGTQILTRHFDMKAPFRVDKHEKGFTLWQWPGDPTPWNREDVSLERLAAFACFRESPDGVLWSQLHPEYLAALQRINASGETTECDWRFAASSQLSGVSLHCRFAIVLPDAAAEKSNEREASVLSALFEHTPIPMPSAEHIAASGVFGSVAAPGSDFREVESTIDDGLIGYMQAPQKRYGYKGWHIFGCTFSSELMTENRPSYHRVWSNNHYGHVGTLWHEVWRATPRSRASMLYWARAAVDHLGSISLCRYDSQRGYTNGKRTPEGQFVHRPGATVAWRAVGNLMHCKAFLPWGSRPYGDPWHDADGGTSGHWVHAHNLLMAWLVDGDRWSKHGYELWLANAWFSTGAPQARQANQSLVDALWAYRYSQREDIPQKIEGALGSLLSKPLAQQRTGPLWAPEWPPLAYELYEDFPALDADGSRRERLKAFIIENANVGDLRIENNAPLALCAKAYEFTGDDKLLTRHAGNLHRVQRRLFRGEGPWNGYGLWPMIGDGNVMRQWPRLLHALRKAKIDRLEPTAEPGQYLASRTRFNNKDDVAARGTEILIAKPQGSASLAIDTANVTGGSLAATSLEALDPSGGQLWRVDRVEEKNRLARPSSRYAYRLERTLEGPAGLYRLKVGTYEVGLFQGLAGGLPECQVLLNQKIDAWPEPVNYCLQVTSGWLVRRAPGGPIKLHWKADGAMNFSHVTVEGEDMPRWERWLPGGTSDEVTLDGPGPWKLDVFGCSQSGTVLHIEAAAEQPLLYGTNLEHIQQIAGQLGG